MEAAVRPRAQVVEDEKNESANGSSGTDSALVGKRPPNSNSMSSGGDKFHLAEHKGKIVVLDFWATWCSHCLETMPDFVRLSGDAAAHNVEVVAVNLEETPAQITAVLKRHQWQFPSPSIGTAASPRNTA